MAFPLFRKLPYPYMAYSVSIYPFTVVRSGILISLNLSDTDITDCWENISLKRAPDIVGIVLCYAGFLHIPPTFGD